MNIQSEIVLILVISYNILFRIEENINVYIQWIFSPFMKTHKSLINLLLYIYRNVLFKGLVSNMVCMIIYRIYYRVILYVESFSVMFTQTEKELSMWI